MRYWFSIICMLLYLASYAQQVGDTLYRSPKGIKGQYNTIHIDRNPSPKFYKAIGNLDISKEDSTKYLQSLGFLKFANTYNGKNVVADLPQKWVSLEMYRDSFYLYYMPCYLRQQGAISFSDSVFIYHTQHYPILQSINELSRIDSSTFQFQLLSVNKNSSLLTIHIIDTLKGIAIFEEHYFGNVSYYPMIDANKLQAVPMIVNFCLGADGSAMTFDFPEVDFSKFIPKK